MFAGLDGLDSTRPKIYHDIPETQDIWQPGIYAKNPSIRYHTSQFHKWKTPKNQQQATTPAAQLPAPLLLSRSSEAPLLAATSHALAKNGCY